MRTYLALGDSYTIGESVRTSERWPMQLAQEIRQHGIEIGEPVIVAQTGWTTNELAAGIDRAELNPTYDLVSFLIGVNNQFRGLDPETYRQEFQQLLERAITFAHGKPEQVIVLSIPDWGATPFAANRDPKAIATAIDHFNTINEVEATKRGAHYINVTDISRQTRHTPGLVAEDGLHPSGAMYQAWVRRVLPIALSALKHSDS